MECTINPFPPRAAKSGHFVILLSLTPDDFTCQRRACGWERVNQSAGVVQTCSYHPDVMQNTLLLTVNSVKHSLNVCHLVKYYDYKQLPKQIIQFTHKSITWGIS